VGRWQPVRSYAAVVNRAFPLVPYYFRTLPHWLPVPRTGGPTRASDVR
jgi:hypothetical protein